VTKLKRLLQVLLSYLPRRLPVGRTEFEKWTSEIIGMSAIEDNDSTRFAIAAMVTHQDATQDHVPQRRFVRQLNKTASNQIALSIIKEIKEKHESNKPQAVPGAPEAVVSAPQG